MNIYVASSWRNSYQPTVVSALRAEGHTVYDFRNPPEGTGFSWRSICHDWQLWTVEQYKFALDHTLSRAGYASDLRGMREADLCVMVLPCGRSAHIEAGWFAGSGRHLIIYAPEQTEPELMYLLAGEPTKHIAASLDELLAMVADCQLRGREMPGVKS
jgi:hypothetical protein